MSEYKFSNPGSLPKPGWIGRSVRLAMAFLSGYALYILFRSKEDFFSGVPDNAMLWVLILLAFHLLPPVVNIGFGKVWHSKPQIWYVIIFYLASLVGGNIEGTFNPEVSGYFLFAMPVYVFTHSGIAFLFSSVLATPGCEMRSLPQLISVIAGKPSKEHYCPGFIDNIDKWEHRNIKKSNQMH